MVACNLLRGFTSWTYDLHGKLHFCRGELILALIYLDNHSLRFVYIFWNLITLFYFPLQQIFEMIIFVLCYCCRKKKKNQDNQDYTKEYRSNERSSLVTGTQPASPTVRTLGGTRSNTYQTIDGQNYTVRSSGNGGEPSLYQNVTREVRGNTANVLTRPSDAPPSYDQLT